VIDNKEFSVEVFIDLSKAFDTINHEILAKKLEHYGIRGITLQWFKSYLSGKQQYVHFNNCSSSNKFISCGVPQGSILGPLLFVLYVNDLECCSNILNFILFADDTNLFYSHENLDVLISLINRELNLLSDWIRANK